MASFQVVKISVESFESSIKCLCEKFQTTDDSYNLIIKEDRYEEFISRLTQNGMDFSTRESYFKRYKERERLRWKSLTVPYFKVPFMIENVILKHCIVGPKYYKGKTSLDSSMNDQPTGRCKRFRLKRSKKIGCNAIMKMTVIKAYPDYEVKDIKDISRKKRQILKLLKENILSNKTSVVSEKLYHISLSKPKMHSHPVWTAFIDDQLDSDLKSEIEMYVEPIETAVIEVTSSGSLVPLDESEFDEVISSSIIPSSESSSRNKNSVSIESIREITKSIYDCSFFLTSSSLDSTADISSLYDILSKAHTLIKTFIECESNIPFINSSVELTKLTKPKQRSNKMKTPIL